MGTVKVIKLFFVLTQKIISKTTIAKYRSVSKAGREEILLLY